MSVLKVSGLRKSYKKGLFPKSVEVLKGIDFEIQPGRITGFLGANGAGKTTTLKCIMGLVFQGAGSIQYFGKAELDNATKSRIGFLPEHPYFYQYLTAQEFLRFYAQLSPGVEPSKLQSRIGELLERVGLSDARDRALKDFSKGMLQKVGLAQAIIHQPELIILDEPMSGLDPDGRQAMSEIITDLAKEGRAIFFSSHLLNDVERLCHDIVILKHGQVAYSGETQKLLESLEKGFEIRYLEDKGDLKKLNVETSDQLQVEIDRLRMNSLQILEIRSRRTSLEEAFVRIAEMKGVQ